MSKSSKNGENSSKPTKSLYGRLVQHILCIRNQSKPSDIERMSNSASVQLQQSSIFKLNDFCFEELFDYLSLRDLHSLGQTCSHLYQLTAVYFQQNYRGIRVKHTDTEIRANGEEINEFLNLVQSIEIDRSKMKWFRLIKPNANSIKKVSFTNATNLKKFTFQFYKTLKQLECIELRVEADEIYGGIYSNLLKNCRNLKSLRIDSFKKYKWLLKKYPTLKTVRLGGDHTKEILKIKIFLEKNPNVQCLEIQEHFLLKNRNVFMTIKAEFDELILDCCNGMDFQSTCDLLNDLQNRGFYNRLKIKVYKLRQEDIELIVQLSTLEKLTWLWVDSDIIWPTLPNLKEVNFCGYKYISIESLATNVMNIERVFILQATLLQILHLVRRLSKLKEIKIYHLRDRIALDVVMLNKARRNLHGATRLIIYLREKYYLATKWTYGNQNTELIVLKRLESTTWNLFDE